MRLAGPVARPGAQRGVRLDGPLGPNADRAMSVTGPLVRTEQYAVNIHHVGRRVPDDSKHVCDGADDGGGVHQSMHTCSTHVTESHFARKSREMVPGWTPPGRKF